MPYGADDCQHDVMMVSYDVMSRCHMHAAKGMAPVGHSGEETIAKPVPTVVEQD